MEETVGTESPKDTFRKNYLAWKAKAEAAKQRDYDFETASGVHNDMLYLPKDGQFDSAEYNEKLGFPGQFPYTRGIHPNQYRGKLWTMRQFAGFGTPEDTNRRFKFLLKEGQTGLSVAFDMPTLMGYDADHELAEGEVGRCGVAISTIEDMERLFDGIPLDEVSTSMTINGPAIILLAMYVVVAERQGANISNLRGTLQNDILKEYIAQKEYIYPPEESMRIIVDMMEWCTENMPLYNTISISGYHIREAGSTAAQELAFTLADGFAYVEAGIERGLDVDKFGRRLSFFFNSHIDFFEEIAKFRAARRIWAKRMRDKYGAKDPRTLMCRFHTQTAGCSLTAQQPEINIARTAFQALAGVLGGTQSLHTNSMDETLALPTEKAAEIALRTQQLIAYETGAPNVADPLGGSWYVEQLTDEIEAQAEDYFSQIDEIGGVIPAIESGFFQREIASASYEYSQKMEDGRRIMVAVNGFTKENEKLEIPILEIEEETEKAQMEFVKSVKQRRDQKAVETALANLRHAAENNLNVMPPILEAVRVSASVGEITDAMKAVFGEYTEPAVF
ncbi:MAG: methylmalonyl-CoA mutase family protein [Lentisphaeria bacterium]|nr:methylmalonyl-CoA mutase family protein [Candidatus Neomarinimicrobiota bacterium]MCF7841553.1 methylmalonyl-CoA mutase family protein [Lentisphaeria bacterium]